MIHFCEKLYQLYVLVSLEINVIETSQLFLQKEQVNRIVLRYKIGTQSDWKKNPGASPRNLPAMPNYESTCLGGRILYGGGGTPIVKVVGTSPGLTPIYVYIFRSLFMPKSILLTPLFAEKNGFVSITFNSREPKYNKFSSAQSVIWPFSTILYHLFPWWFSIMLTHFLIVLQHLFDPIFWKNLRSFMILHPALNPPPPIYVLGIV